MNGAHDVGGMHGFGPVAPERDEPVFHAEWERRVFGLMLGALYPLSTIDRNRYVMEQMGNVEYLTTPYYEHWLFAIERLLVEQGVITEAERLERLRAVTESPERFAPARGQERDDLARRRLAALAAGGPSTRDVDAAPRFRVGDAVRTVERNPAGHTRLPRYARGKAGTVVRSHGAHVFPDTNAHELGEHPQPLYTVRFEARDLWGDDRAAEAVHLDLWDSHLRPERG